MTKADSDGNGRIDFDEFLTVVGDATRHLDADLKVSCFNFSLCVDVVFFDFFFLILFF